MKKLSEKGRKVLRMIYRGLGVTAVSLIFQACYGMPPPDDSLYPVEREDLLIQGQVKSKKTGEPVVGIGIWIKDVLRQPYFTYNDGSFYIHVLDVPKQDNYTVVFTDIDGLENGGIFKQHTINLTMYEALAESPLIIELEEVNAE